MRDRYDNGGFDRIFRTPPSASEDEDRWALPEYDLGVMLAIFFAIVFGYSSLRHGVNGLRDFEFSKRVRYEGVVTQAGITAEHLCLMSRRQDMCSVDYAFEADGKPFQRTLFEKHLGKPGQVIQVTYLRSSPSYSFPGGVDSAAAGARAALPWSLFYCLSCLLILPFLFYKICSNYLSQPAIFFSIAYGFLAYAVWIGASLAGISRL